MSAISFAKSAYSAFNREKPHSSITEWVEILTSPNYDDEAYDGIPELVDSINIQATGPAEASRAIRKKLKHGDSHHQYRALVILRALVENGGHKFQTSFADAQLTDAIKTMASDPTLDPKVKKKLVAVLAAWQAQFKDDPSMSLVAGLYKQCRVDTHRQSTQLSTQGLVMETENERRLREEKERKREEEKRKAKDEEKQRKEEEERRKKAEKEKKKQKTNGTQTKIKRKPFNFEEEKPQILTAIASASQASNNLLNAMTLVNPEHDSVVANARVQECLENAKIVRRQIVRYIQLVENEDMIGTLIDTNERIISALQTYDRLSNPEISEQDVKDVQDGLAAMKVTDSELGKLQQKQRAAVQRSISRSTSMITAWGPESASEAGHAGPYVHPDLQDLSFGSLGAEQRNLPPPIRPSVPAEDDWHRGNLSDYSDYESSDEDEHRHAVASGSSSAYSRGKPYVNVSDEGVGESHGTAGKSLLNDDEDPFADPFVDQ